MYKYHCLNPLSQTGLDHFNTNYQKTEEITDADCVLVRSAKMHDITLDQKTVAVARAGAGVNNIPLEAYAKQGVVVFNTPGANANGVKELVIAGMILASRDVVGGVNWSRENASDPDISKNMEKAKKQFKGTELSGKKLGVIGLGAIGQMVANAAVSLGMEVYGYDPYISVNAAWNLSREVHHETNPARLYAEADFITVHIPLLDSTRGMINREAIESMKKGVILLNYSRDVIYDEAAVMDGIAAGKIRKYVTDFPNPLTAGKEGVIATPHLGASTDESEENCAVMAVKEIMDYMENGNITHSVNYPDCNMGICTADGRLALLHHNTKGVIAKYTSILGDAGLNITDMTNKGKGDFAYSLLDYEGELKEETIQALNAIDEVYKVRVIK